MSVRPIVQGDVPALRQVSEPVREFGTDLSLLLTDLLDTLQAHRALGLAAPQIGVPLRAIVIDRDSGPVAFVNPQIVERAGEVAGYESCPSFTDMVFEVKRPERIRVFAQDAGGKPVEETVEGLEAHILCHEVDHLNGVLFMDHLPDDALFEQLLTLNLASVSEDDSSKTSSVGAFQEENNSDSDLRLAADLFADAAWKAVLAQQLLEETGRTSVRSRDLDWAIQVLERAGSALEDTIEPSE